jgi:hypothetical protein
LFIVVHPLLPQKGYILPQTRSYSPICRPRGAPLRGVEAVGDQPTLGHRVEIRDEGWAEVSPFSHVAAANQEVICLFTLPVDGLVARGSPRTDSKFVRNNRSALSCQAGAKVILGPHPIGMQNLRAIQHIITQLVGFALCVWNPGCGSGPQALVREGLHVSDRPFYCSLLTEFHHGTGPGSSVSIPGRPVRGQGRASRREGGDLEGSEGCGKRGTDDANCCKCSRKPKA